ncbi:hypothetical protein ABTX62_05715 [Streptomyces sp. NPDC096046]
MRDELRELFERVGDARSLPPQGTRLSGCRRYGDRDVLATSLLMAAPGCV